MDAGILHGKSELYKRMFAPSLAKRYDAIMERQLKKARRRRRGG